MVKQKRGAMSGRKGGSVIDEELNNPTPHAVKNNNKKNKNQKQKKQSRGK